MPLRLARPAAVALVLAASVTIFEPLKSALFNWAELTVGPAALLGALALPFVWCAVAAVAFFVGCALISAERTLALLVGLLLAVAIQGTFFVWDYGPFDGRPLDWRQYTALGVVDAVVWVALFAFAIVRPAPLAARAGEIWKGVLLFQCLSLGASYLQVAPLAEKQAASVDATASPRVAQDLLTFSRERNAIVIVVDTVQSDFFAELLTDPNFANSLPPGFAYYRNAVSTYPTTYLSVQNVLTSRAVPQQGNLREWQQRQMKVSLPNLLRLQGFRLSVVLGNAALLSCDSPDSALECTSPPAMVARLAGRDARDEDAAEDARMLLGVASFRVSPHFLRPWAYADGEWRVRALFPDDSALAGMDRRIASGSRRDMMILDSLAERAVAADVPPTFKFLHLYGAHPAATTLRTCEWNTEYQLFPSGSTAGSEDRARIQRRQFVETAGCVLSRTFEFLDTLNRIGTYDNSVIFIVGDHGQVDVPLDLAFASPPVPGAGPSAVATAKSRGVPLFLAKPLGARAPFSVSDVPVSLCDVPASVSSELGGPATFDCESIFELGGARAEPRMHYSKPRDLGRNLWGVHLGPFGWFEVRGHSWLEDSWTKLGK